MRPAAPALLGASLLLASCASDPAVEVARCIERGVRELRGSGAAELTLGCTLPVEGPHVVVLHAGGPLDPDALRQAGVTEEAVEQIRRWRERDPAVYVVPLGRSGVPAMTTSQGFFATIPRTAAVTKTDPHTGLLLRRGTRGVEASGVW